MSKGGSNKVVVSEAEALGGFVLSKRKVDAAGTYEACIAQVPASYLESGMGGGSEEE